MERAEAAKRLTASRTLDKNAGGSVTLSTEEIRESTGNTPLGAGVSASLVEHDGRDVRGGGGDGQAAVRGRGTVGSGASPDAINENGQRDEGRRDPVLLVQHELV
ncbi:uncharacterized protein IUM83_14200 [Phytophthora cinnamomi]|uniref:uncharacterized protein n=1 Tax=Phytophthora cinnamomi TaxID=4785 RepID=UPI00355971DA|nr:hypothetical protein IUM83_14200 [Phytophthora cinnamomi]